MAGDWIKIEKATLRKPEVLLLSQHLNIHPDHAFTLCVRFWIWCDDQLTSCHAPGVTTVTLDHVIGHAGCADALVKVGWLRVRDGSLEVPNFDRHLSQGAKTRALSGNRKHKQRTKDVTPESRSQRDKSVTREEKERDIHPSDVDTPLPPSGGRVRAKATPFDPRSVPVPESINTPEFLAAWGRWIDHRVQRKAPLTPIAADACLKRLAGWGLERAIAAIEYTVAMGWQGLREEEAKPVTAGGRSQVRGLTQGPDAIESFLERHS